MELREGSLDSRRPVGFEVPENALKEGAEIGHRIAEKLDLYKRNTPYNKLTVGPQRGRNPTVHLEDVSAIPFVTNVPGVEEYQHRARVRAETGDLFVSTTRADDCYEKYCREVLELGVPEQYVVPTTDGETLPIARMCSRPDCIEPLVDFVEAKAAVDIHPYMAIESVWQLANKLQKSTDTDMAVVGPPPPVLWAANDKATLANIVSEVAGPDWNVDTRFADRPEQMVAHLESMAKSYSAVGLKRTRCASAMGNIVFESDQIRSTSTSELTKRVESFLDDTGWEKDERVLAVEWVDADSSPSTQMWLPADSSKPPVLEGVYEQILKGPEKVFVGSKPSSLRDSVDESLAEVSYRLAKAFQVMGYKGRCSFDFVVGDRDDESTISVVECNGRWGGTSTPMHLVDRLFPGRRPAYIATDYVTDELKGMEFEQLYEKLEDHLYRPATETGRFVLYNVGPLTDYGKFDVISLGESSAEASRGLDEVLPDLLNLDRE